MRSTNRTTSPIASARNRRRFLKRAAIAGVAVPLLRFPRAAAQVGDADLPDHARSRIDEIRPGALVIEIQDEIQDATGRAVPGARVRIEQTTKTRKPLTMLPALELA